MLKLLLAILMYAVTLMPAAFAQLSVDAFWPWGSLDQPAAQKPRPLLKVSCATDELAVTADNASMADILKDVGECLGAEIDISKSAGGKLIRAEVGPGPSNQILAGIFENDFDYMIVGGFDSRIRLIVVRDRTGDKAKSKTQETNPAAGMKPTFVDDQGIARLPSGLTPAEAGMTPEQLSQEFEKAKNEQQKDDEAAGEESPPPK
jgi:hypothetical protein